LRSLLGFLAVGSAGFIFEAIVLLVLHDTLGAPALVARSLSLPSAIALTYWLNRIWTFKSEDPNRVAEFGRYLVVQAVGNGFNFLVFALVMSLAALQRWPGSLIGLALGSAAGLVVNYLGARFVAFRGGGRSQLAKAVNDV
jgi:putative flippase GtrA